MNAPLRHPAVPMSEPPVPGRPVVALEGISKTYTARGGTPVEALRAIDIAVTEGTVTGVIGRSGAGKSTLIRLVNGLERPTSGRVVVDGVEISALDEAGLRQARRSIGMIFQHFNLLSSRTAAGNVALPLEIAGFGRAEINSRVDELLALVGLSDKRDRHPAELSGGQKQRVGIARALATRPRVLLCDEATSALDPETTRQILDLLRTINRDLGVTILLITHEMAVVRAVADEVAVLDRGTIVERGDVYDVFTAPAHETTRSFLAGEAGRALPAPVAARLLAQPAPGSAPLVRIVFRGPHATDPIIARLAREAGVDANIVAGAIDEIGGRPFGTLTVQLDGSQALERALPFLHAHGLHTEVLGHVR